MSDEEILIEARKRLAAQYHHAYHINAILSGDWDRGGLIQNKIAEIKAEQDSRSRKGKRTESCEAQSA
jgi:hypothetical protein